MTAASLYRHVRNKDELLVLLADEISGQVPMIAEGATWEQALTTMALGVRRVLLAHHDAARLLASTRPTGPPAAAATSRPIFIGTSMSAVPWKMSVGQRMLPILPTLSSPSRTKKRGKIP